MTMTRSSGELFRPSISCINSVITPRCACAPPLSRDDMRAPNKASISSRKTTHGDSRRASVKTALTSFSASPTYYYGSVSRLIRSDIKSDVHTMSMTSEGEMASMRHPASLARARTTSVFPVPGGPNNKQPVIPCSFNIPCWKAVGCKRGRDTIVRTESIV